jgi:hypothetical protein
MRRAAQLIHARLSSSGDSVSMRAWKNGVGGGLHVINWRDSERKVGVGAGKLLKLLQRGLGGR